MAAMRKLAELTLQQLFNWATIELVEDSGKHRAPAGRRPPSASSEVTCYLGSCGMACSIPHVPAVACQSALCSCCCGLLPEHVQWLPA